MRVFENQTFERLFDDESAALVSGLEFRNCSFKNCSISVAHSPELRTTVRDVRLIGCRQTGCSAESSILEDVLVEGLKTSGQTLHSWGAVFKHVVLRGKIDYLMTSNDLFATVAKPEEQRAFDRANAEYYRHVDWALDISQGEFKDLEIRGVPGRLIKRDPQTQLLITRQALFDANWRKLEFHTNITPVAIDIFLERDEPDYVLVAPKRDNTFRERLADIELLRRAGIAEPD